MENQNELTVYSESVGWSGKGYWTRWSRKHSVGVPVQRSLVYVSTVVGRVPSTDTVKIQVCCIVLLANEAQGFRSTLVVIEEGGYGEAEIADCPQSQRSHSLSPPTLYCYTYIICFFLLSASLLHGSRDFVCPVLLYPQNPDCICQTLGTK